MHITIDKTSDQDPPGNRRKHTPHSVLTYKEKTQQIIYTTMQKWNNLWQKEKEKIKHSRDCNSPVCSSSNDGMKTDKTERIFWLYSPQGIVTCGVTSLEPDWFGCQGWRVLGQSELGARSRWCVPKMNLEFLFPSGETPPPDTAE